jgi:hypothetical protein
MPKNSQEGMLSDWEQLLGAVGANREDLPHVETVRARLAAHVEDLRLLHSDRDRLRTETRRMTEEILQGLAKGQDLAARLRAYARSTYGIHSDKLLEFGIKPIRGKKRQKGPSPEGCWGAGDPRSSAGPK